MATGILGVADLAAATDTSVYTTPADTFSVVSVSLCNRGGSAAQVRIAVSSSGTPNDADYLEFDSQISANGVVERTGIVLDAGKIVVVRSNAVNVSAVCMGIETSTA
jgi:hypothetical protein|tara:strand:- start:611 stop:931 length:321 start_codon:yes stop_codon:yes gene_type:complete